MVHLCAWSGVFDADSGGEHHIASQRRRAIGAMEMVVDAFVDRRHVGAFNSIALMVGENLDGEVARAYGKIQSEPAVAVAPVAAIGMVLEGFLSSTACQSHMLYVFLHLMCHYRHIFLIDNQKIIFYNFILSFQSFFVFLQFLKKE